MISKPIKAGLIGKCGQCGEGKLFKGYLKFRDECDHCGQDLTVADTADGPAFFVGFLAMIVFAPFFFLVPLIDVPLLVKIGLSVALVTAIIGFCLLLLPIFKGVLLNLQIDNRAEEANFESTGTHGKAPNNWKS